MLSWILLAAVHKAFGYRGDGEPQLYYFSGADFGVSSEAFSFHSGKNLLRGEKFFLPGVKPKALVFFFHGLGGGYSSYTNEIAAIVKQGYWVYAYDNTGSMTSEGETIGCLAQSLLDQKAFFEYFDPLDQTGLPRYAIGHSWGGFTALGALDPKYHVDKVVSISGFLSLVNVMETQVKALKKFEWLLRRALRKGYGRYGDLEMTDLIAHTSARVLYIQGEADNLVTPSLGYDVLARLFKDKENVELMLVPGAMHNPYWTLEAQKYFYDLAREKHFAGRTFDNSVVVDYSILNHDDPKVMGRIFSFFAE